MTKTCTKCGIEKPPEDFYRNRSQKTGRDTRCKACARKYYEANRAAHLEQGRRYRRTKPEVALKATLKKYGLTVEDYWLLHEAQGGKCWICLRTQKKMRLGVDHDHKTGEVRGLLCQHCNTMLGYYHENAGIFARAAEYLASPPADEVFDTPRRHVNAPPQRVQSSDPSHGD